MLMDGGPPTPGPPRLGIRAAGAMPAPPPLRAASVPPLAAAGGEAGASIL